MASFGLLFCVCCDESKQPPPVDIYIEGAQRYDNGSSDDVHVKDPEGLDPRSAKSLLEQEEVIRATNSYVVTPGDDTTRRQASGARAKVSILIQHDEEKQLEQEEDPAEGISATRTQTDGSLRRSRLKTYRPSTHSSLGAAEPVGARASYTALQSLGLDLSTRRRSSVQTTAENAIQDSYEFLDVLGQGGFGSVHKSRRKKDGKVVAIKCIKATATNPAVFERELDQARKLRHPNIVQLMEAYRDRKMFYLVMELCSGGDLLSLVADKSLRLQGDAMTVGLEDDLLALYAWQMLSAVAYLHYHYIAHRDIKPENYMRATPTSRAQLKLIDMGLSSTVLPGETLKEIVGTMTTIAPEVHKGKYTEKCDLWSVGITLYICAVCMEPWLSPSGLSYLDELGIQRCLKDETWQIPYDQRRWSLKQPEIRDLVETLLQRDPAKRPRAQDVLLKNAWLQEVNNAKGCCFCL